MTERTTHCLAPEAIKQLRVAFEQADAPWVPAIGARARFVVGIEPTAAIRAWHRPILASARRQPVAGITLGPVVYVVRAALLDDWPLVAHECAHVGQVDRLGTVRFLARYGLDYARGRVRGLAHHAAYLAIADEVEARRVENAARDLGRPDRLLVPDR